MTVRDENGARLTRNVHRVADGWQVTVWWGGVGIGTNVQHRVYRTRTEARAADVSTWGDVIRSWPA